MSMTNRYRTRARAVRLIGGGLILVVVSVLATGCAGSRRVGGSRLSAAVEEARDDRDRDDGEREKRERDDEKRRENKDRERRRVLHAGREVPEPAVVVVETRSRRHRHDRRDHDESTGPLNLSLGFSAGRSGFEDRSLDRSRFLALTVRGSLPETRPRLELGVSLAGAFLDTEPSLSQSLQDVVELSVGLSARYYAAPRSGPVGLYGVAGFELGALWWDYASPILIEDYGTVYEVGDDWMGTYSPYLGLGVSLFGSNGFQVGASLVGGYKFFDRHTQEGLYNDVFDPAPFARFQVDFSHTLR